MVCVRSFQWMSTSSFRICDQIQASTSVLVLSSDPLNLRRLALVSRFGGNLILSLICFIMLGCLTNWDFLRSRFRSAVRSCIRMFWSVFLLSVGPCILHSNGVLKFGSLSV